MIFRIIIWLCLICILHVSLLSGQCIANLQQYMAENDGVEISMAVHASDGEILYGYREHQPVTAASIIKVPVLMALYDTFGSENGHLMPDTCILTDDLKVGGAGSVQFLPAGSALSYDQLARLMISQSDNTATNIILSKLKMEAVNHWLMSHGYYQTFLRRKMMDMKAIRAGLQNTTTPSEINRIFLQLYNMARRGSRTAATMLPYFHACDDHLVMPAGASSGVIIAHKSGTLENLRADAGIIFPEKPLFVSIFVKGCPDISKAESIIAEITRHIIRIFSSKQER